MIKAYVTDVKALFGLSPRNSKGQFVKGNKFRFRKVWINVGTNDARQFLVQSALVGSFFRAL